MKLTKSQKIYAAVLGVGLCALAADQLFGNAQPPTDGPAAATAMPGESLSAQAMTTAAPAAKGPSLAARLRALSANGKQDASTPRDAFKASAAWSGKSDDTDLGWDERVAKFRSAHALKAVMQSGEGGQAMVDGSLISIGESVDEFRLIRVEPTRAVFIADGKQAELVLPGVAVRPK